VNDRTERPTAFAQRRSSPHHIKATFHRRVTLIDNVLSFIGQYEVENGTARTASDGFRRNHLYRGLLGNIAIVDAHAPAWRSAMPRAAIAIGDRQISATPCARTSWSSVRRFWARYQDKMSVPFARAVRRPDGRWPVSSRPSSTLRIRVRLDTNDYGARWAGHRPRRMNDRVSFVALSGGRSSAVSRRKDSAPTSPAVAQFASQRIARAGRM